MWLSVTHIMFITACIGQSRVQLCGVPVNCTSMLGIMGFAILTQCPTPLTTPQPLFINQTIMP